MSRRVKAHGPPHGQRGRRRSSTTAVVVYSSTAVVHHISWASVKTHEPPHGQDRCRSSSSIVHHIMGRGPDRPMKTRGPHHGQGGAAHIEPTSHGPRPGPAHHIFEVSRLSPARPIKFKKNSARPGPAHHNFQNGLARPGPSAHDKP